MSLWTPGGEVPVDRSGQQSPQPGPAAGPEAVALSDEQLEALGIDPTQLTAEQRAQAEQMVAQLAESQARIAATPAADLVANHAMGLYELAAIKLTASDPPQLDEAKLAIEALRALVDAVGEQLGEATETLTQALNAVQLGFVEAKEAAGQG
ncbi:MAG: hypothetical protein JJU45_13140 [Acidimicrobiia bacterium]|nr:hypothetical protein [Acidimicrobiia bacterium]